MPASAEHESEILLGNKQLLLVFAVVAGLLAIAFTGGFMLGKSSAEKKALAASESASTSSVSVNEATGGPITQKLTPDDTSSIKPDAAKAASQKTEAVSAPPVEPVRTSKPEPKPLTPLENSDTKVLGAPPSKLTITPKHGQSFVQVMAVAEREAEATADVLRQHEMPAHIAPAPGNTGVYRVLVGPSKDAADLRSMEDELRKIGYVKCFVQHY